jgi:hypothetical protein
LPRKPPLHTRPQFLRSSIARGLAAGDQATPSSAAPVDPTGGDSGAGLIRGMAVITRGEALGHSMWIDAVFLQQVTDAINAQANGVKARFTHPGLSGDGLGKFTGRVKGASLDGDIVRADLHFSETAHETPDGDLAAYLMQLAGDDPDAFGNSIVFLHDWKAEEDFQIENGATWEETDWGEEILVGFESPDPDNVHHYPHARLAQLRAVDAVDEPAANPAGLFHRGQETAQEAEALLSYGLGLTTERPAVHHFEVNPERLTGFMQRFLDRHGLAIVPRKEGNPMPLKNALTGKKRGALAEGDEEEKKVPADDQPGDSADDDEKKEEAEDDEEKKDLDDDEEDKELEDDEDKDKSSTGSKRKGASLSRGQQFIDAFGTDGAVWFAQGKTFAQAKALHAAKVAKERDDLAADNAKLRKQLKAARGEEKPLSFSGNPHDGQEPEAKKFNNLTPGAAKFAAGIKLPGQ